MGKGILPYCVQIFVLNARLFRGPWTTRLARKGEGGGMGGGGRGGGGVWLRPHVKSLKRSVVFILAPLIFATYDTVMLL